MSFNIFLQESKPKAKKLEPEPKKTVPEPETKVVTAPLKPMCRDHPSMELSMICFDCVHQICTDCIKDHQDHKYKKIIESKQDLMKKLNLAKDDIVDLKESFDKTLVKIQIEKSENVEAVQNESEGKIKELQKEKTTLEEEIAELKQYLEEKRLKLLEIDQEIRIVNQKTQVQTMNSSQKKMDDLYVEEKEAEAKVKKCNSILDATASSLRDGSTDSLISALILINNELKVLAPPKITPISIPTPTPEPKREMLSPKRVELPSKPSTSTGNTGRANDTPQWMQNVKKRDIFAVNETPKESAPITKPVKTLSHQEVDPDKCTFKGKSFEGGVDQDLSFELTARNCDSDVLDIDLKQLFKFRLLDYPEDYAPKLRVKARDQPTGTLGIVFSADKPSTYVLQIEYQDQDIQGSPFSIVISEKHFGNSVTEEQSFDLPVICHYAGAYNPYTREFMIKPNVMSNTIYCFDLKKNSTRTFDLPIVAWSLCADTHGNIYCGDNKKNFYKFDSKFNQVWTTQADDKYALGVYTDNTHLYGLLHKGPILKIDMDTGKILETITPSDPFVHAFNFVFYKDFIMIGDKKEILLCNTSGKVIRQISGFENCAFCVIEGKLFICNNKGTKWIRLDI